MGGARWTVLDPSGPLARLTELPEIAPFARHINLMRAAPGVLNPYRVVAEPRLEHFTDTASATAEQQWRDERRAAAATRRQLVVQVLMGLLPHDVARMPETRIRLQRAVKQVGGAPDRHPGQVVDLLRQHAGSTNSGGDEHAGIVADFLDERRELPQAALLFPTGDGAVDPWTADGDIRLTVLTMQGLALPRPGSPRDEWSDTEALGVELLNLASWLTQRTIYDADPNLRKGVALDETHFLSQVPTGKVLIDRLARDSRKFNVRALFASQLAGDLLRVPGFASLVNAVFVGRTDDAEAQADALRLLRVPTGIGYEPLLATLSQQLAGRPSAAVRLRRRARRGRGDPGRSVRAAPRAPPGGAGHQPVRRGGGFGPVPHAHRAAQAADGRAAGRRAGDRPRPADLAGAADPAAELGRAVKRLLVVLALAVGMLLVGTPAFAQPPAGGCAIAPEPDRPASGLVGLLDPTPPGTGDPASVYGEVGYAGTTWRTYDLCNRPDATTASTDTWVGNTLFNVAKVIVGAANGLHYQLGSADQLDGLDDLLHDGVGAMYRSVFTTWVGVALLVLAIGVLWLAARGDLARQAQKMAVAVGALAVAGLVYTAPVSLLKASDAVLFDGISAMQQGFLTELGAGDPDTLPETLTQEIVYANWVRGQFGSTEVPQARDLGRDLLRSQTFTRAEVAAGQDTAETATKKKQQFTELTKKLGDRLPQFQGIAGSRVGTGGTALLQSVTLAAFPAAAKLVVFVAMIILRLLVLFAPLIAVVAIMRSDVVVGLFRVVAGVLVNAVLAAALAAAHAWLVVMMLRPGSGVAPVLTLIVAAVVSALFWMLVRPMRRLFTLGSMVLPRPQPRFRAESVPAPVPVPAIATPTRTSLAGPAPPVRAPLVSAVRTTAQVLPRPAPTRSPLSILEPPDPDRRSTGDHHPPGRFPALTGPVGAAIPAPRGAGRRGGADRAPGRYLGDRDTLS